jgi:hypothetical protein
MRRSAAISLGSRHAEIAEDLFLGVAAFLVADHHARQYFDGQAADDAWIVAVRAVTVQLAEIREQAADVVQSAGPLRMAYDLRSAW